MLRKMLAVLLAALCLSVPALAEEEEDTLLMRAISLADQMNSNTQNEVFLSLLAGNNADLMAMVQGWGEGHSLPTMVVQTSADSRIIKMLMWDSIGNIGANVLAGTTMMETVTIFADDDVGDGAYVMLYESNETPILVVWHSEDGAVRMRSMYLPFEDLQGCSTRNEVAKWFQANQIPLIMEPVRPQPIIVSQPADEDELDHALYTAKRMDALAEDEAYCISVGASDAVLAMIQEWAVGEPGDPVLSLKVNLPLESDSIRYLNEELLPDIEVDEQLLAKAVNQIPTILLGRYCGTEQLVASSLIRGETLFADGGHSTTGLYLFIYENKTPIIVASYVREGAVNMRAFYLPIEELANARTIDEVKDFFEDAIPFEEGLLPIDWELAE